MKTYTGSCHCGKVTFEATMEELTKALSCNCSYCSRQGWLLSFIPASQFKLLSGEENLSEYRFNKEIIKHFFCKTCGTHPFGRGPGPSGEMVAVNVRCLQGVDPKILEITEFNGRDL